MCITFPIPKAILEQDGTTDTNLQEWLEELEDYRDLLKDKFAEASKGTRNEEMPDFDSVCSGTTLRVHRINIGAHSEPFMRLCETAFKESGERKMTLHGDPISAVKAMIEYFGTFDYADPMLTSDTRYTRYTPRANIGSPRSMLEAHAQVCTFADKYGIPGLGDIATFKFFGHTKSDVPVDDGFYGKIADEFVPATEHIYKHTLTGDTFRGSMRGFWTVERHLLRHVDVDDFYALVAEVPEFAIELISCLSGVTDLFDLSGQARQGPVEQEPMEQEPLQQEPVEQEPVDWEMVDQEPVEQEP